jgi:folate-binding protein YgfZ
MLALKTTTPSINPPLSVSTVVDWLRPYQEKQAEPVFTYLNTAQETALSVFKLQGVDVANYLQRRTSNDVTSLRVGEGHANTFLDKKAYLQAVFSLHRTAEETFYALVPQAVATEFEQEVLKFKIMEQFTCTNETNHWQVVIQLAFQSAENIVANHIHPVVNQQGLTAYKIQQPFWVLGHAIHTSYDGAVWLIPQETDVPRFLATIFFENQPKVIPLANVKILQQLWGVPQWGKELTSQIQLPETGLEHWCVSYTKGCFLGQETVARVRTYGGVQQTLMGLKLQGLSAAEVIQFPCNILQDTKKIATLTSGIWEETTQTYYTLAYVNRAFRLPQGAYTTGFTLTTCNNTQLPVMLEVVLLPFEQTLSAQHASATVTDQAHRLHELAMTHFVENNTTAALQVLESLLTQYPDFLPAYETKGVLLSRLSRFEEAIITMQQLLAKNDKHVMAYTNLSIFWLKLGDKEQAEHFKAKATSVAMGNKMAEAMAKKAATATSHPTKEAIIDTDALHAHQQRLTDKIALFQHALQFSPTDALAHYGLGTTYLELHQLEAAVEAFEQAITLNPKHSQAYVLLAETHYTLHHFEQAAQIISTGITVASTRGDLQPLAQLKTLQAKILPLAPQ